MMLAGGLAFWIYLYLPWPFGFWTVVSVAAVIRPGFTNTFGKILMRIVGTIIGGVLAYFIYIASAGNNFLMVSLFFLAIIFSSYIALQKTIFSYAGIVIGLTLTIVLSASLILGNPVLTMSIRMTDILIGISCVAAFNIILQILFPKKEAVIETLNSQINDAYFAINQWRKNKDFVITSIGIALAASLTYLPWLYFRYPGGYWAAISCFFIMEESFLSAQQRSWFRFFSHIVAAAIGGLAAIIIGNHINFLAFPLMLSFFIFGYMMVKSKTLSNAGNTMGIALVIMLLADPGTATALNIVAARFFNVIGGIAVGLLVTYGIHLVQRRTIPKAFQC